MLWKPRKPAFKLAEVREQPFEALHSVLCTRFPLKESFEGMKEEKDIDMDRYGCTGGSTKLEYGPGAIYAGFPSF